MDPHHFAADRDGIILTKDDGQRIHYHQYQYTKLCSPTSIRLIKPCRDLQRTSWVNSQVQLHFSIVERDLNDHDINFKALSYAWGSNVKNSPLLIEGEVDGMVVMITPNAWHALQRLGHSPGPEYLWLDQICIDQDDNTERNQQVGLMTKI